MIECSVCGEKLQYETVITNIYEGNNTTATTRKMFYYKVEPCKECMGRERRRTAYER